jgi:hypothetical protein
VGLAGLHARRIETVTFGERHDLKNRVSRIDPWIEMRSAWASGKAVRKVIEIHRSGPRAAKRRAKEGVA